MQLSAPASATPFHHAAEAARTSLMSGMVGYARGDMDALWNGVSDAPELITAALTAPATPGAVALAAQALQHAIEGSDALTEQATMESLDAGAHEAYRQAERALGLIDAALLAA